MNSKKGSSSEYLSNYFSRTSDVAQPADFEECVQKAQEIAADIRLNSSYPELSVEVGAVFDELIQSQGSIPQRQALQYFSKYRKSSKKFRIEACLKELNAQLEALGTAYRVAECNEPADVVGAKTLLVLQDSL